MPAYARHVTVADDEVGIYHCIARCVRGAFLCATDPLTGHNYEHRKDWIRERLERLASILTDPGATASERRPWIETVRQFGRWFKRAVGRRASFKRLAEQTGRRWFHGQRAAGVAFP